MRLDRVREQRLAYVLEQLDKNTKERKRLFERIRELDIYKARRPRKGNIGRKVEELKSFVCDQYDVNYTAMHSRSRRQDHVLSRQVVMQILVREFNYTFDGAAAVFDLDHATAIHACKAIDSLVQYKTKTGKEPYLRRVESPVSKYNRVMVLALGL